MIYPLLLRECNFIWGGKKKKDLTEVRLSLTNARILSLGDKFVTANNENNDPTLGGDTLSYR